MEQRNSDDQGWRSRCCNQLPEARGASVTSLAQSNQPNRGIMFLSENKQFKTADALRAWLVPNITPNWKIEGSTYHNTYKPDISDWNGMATMLGMQTVSYTHLTLPTSDLV